MSSFQNAPSALKELIADTNIELFETFEVLSEKESRERYEILLKNYALSVQIESRVLSDIALNQIIPSVVEYQKKLISTLEGMAGLNIKDGDKALRTIVVIPRPSEVVKIILGPTGSVSSMHKIMLPLFII